jgi:hypothetical protein
LHVNRREHKKMEVTQRNSAQTLLTLISAVKKN